MKKYKKILWVVLALVTVGLLGIGYFFVSNHAPILTGNVIRNIEYKPGLLLDLYEPTKQVYDQTPVVLYIHGGAWITGIKETLNFNRFNQAANALRASGYAIVSINYTLAESSRSPFPTCIQDAADAVGWLSQHAATYRFDLQNVGLFGESAGAHIAMMLAYSPPSFYAKDSLPIRFNYVVDVYGPNQLEGIYHAPIVDTLSSIRGKMPKHFQSYLNLEKYIFGFDPRQDLDKALQIMRTYSPYQYLGATAPPTLLIQGDADRIVPLLQSTSLQLKLDSLGVENELHILKGADHAFINATPEQKAEVQQWIVAFIHQHYRDKK